jgi:hypothetical protein
MTLNRAAKIAVALAVLAVAATTVWAVWFRSDVRRGFGAFQAEHELCRSRLEQDLQHVPMEYYEDRTWHRGSKPELHIGGMARLLGGDPRRPQVFSYECLARNGVVLNVEAL